MRRDAFLILRRNEPDEVVEGTFSTVTRRLGMPLRTVLPDTEWASVDGDLSLIRLRDDAPAVAG